MLYYTGVGSRETPKSVLKLMEQIAEDLALHGLRLRSGHAAGADRAFERGAGGNADIYLPWRTFGIKPYGNDPGQQVIGTPIVCDSQCLKPDFCHTAITDACLDKHRNWSHMKQSVQKLLFRDALQVLGHGKEPEPSKMLICWMAGSGGTDYAVHIARQNCVPVVNMFSRSEQQVRNKIGSIMS